MGENEETGTWDVWYTEPVYSEVVYYLLSFGS